MSTITPERIKLAQNSSWIDYSSYWLNSAPQLSDEWYILHKGRITASKFGACVGANALSLADQIIDFMPIIEKPMLMQHGIVTEREAREWYARKYQVTIKEVGLAVPKWNPYLGASIDGDIVNSPGIIEVKCPLKMYAPINEYLLAPQSRPSPYIWKSHYDQMQGSLAVLNKQWCDYIVYCTPENKVFIDRVYFNHHYWHSILYPKLLSFIETQLKPRLKDSIFPIIPTNII